MPIRWHALKQHRHEAPWLVVDLFVLLLISVNLLWLLLDKLLLDSGAGILLNQFRPDIAPWYEQHWHRPALLFDTVLTGLLIGELLLRWGLAVRGKTYHRWFFYPFIHWYDVLGCLPGLQALRLFRLVSIFYRLNRMGLLLFGTGLIDTVQKYYNVILEEISDRIVLNVLEGVQQEIRSGGPVSEQVRARILDPHRQALVQWVAVSLSQVTAHSYRQHEQALAVYLEQVIAEAVRNSPEWHEVVSGLVNAVVARILRDLGQPDNLALGVLSGSLYDNFTRPDPQLSHTVEQIALEAIDLIKAQVSIQQWKREEAGEKS